MLELPWDSPDSHSPALSVIHVLGVDRFPRLGDPQFYISVQNSPPDVL